MLKGKNCHLWQCRSFFLEIVSAMNLMKVRQLARPEKIKYVRNVAHLFW